MALHNRAPASWQVRAADLMVEAVAHLVFASSFLLLLHTPAVIAFLLMVQPSSPHDFRHASGRNVNCSAAVMAAEEGAGTMGAAAISEHMPLVEPLVAGTMLLSGVVDDLSLHCMSVRLWVKCVHRVFA